MKRLLGTAAVAAIVAAAAAPAFAHNPAARGVSAADTAFVTQAAQGGETEVKLAALALQRGSSAAVTSFARRMDADHGKANAQLVAIAKRKGLMAPSDVGPANKAAIAKLQSLHGAAFERAYLKGQMAAHQQTIALFEREAQNGKDPDIVAFAKQTLPTIEQHLAMDQRDMARAGSGSSM